MSELVIHGAGYGSRKFAHLFYPFRLPSLVSSLVPYICINEAVCGTRRQLCLPQKEVFTTNDTQAVDRRGLSLIPKETFVLGRPRVLAPHPITVCAIELNVAQSTLAKNTPRSRLKHFTSIQFFHICAILASKSVSTCVSICAPLLALHLLSQHRRPLECRSAPEAHVLAIRSSPCFQHRLFYARRKFEKLKHLIVFPNVVACESAD